MLTLAEQIKQSLLYHDILRWKERGQPDNYDILAEELAERCWLRHNTQEMALLIRDVFLDYCHPLIVPSVSAFEPLAEEIWDIRGNYKV